MATTAAAAATHVPLWLIVGGPYPCQHLDERDGSHQRSSCVAHVARRCVHACGVGWCGACVCVCVSLSLSLSRPLFDDCLVSIWDVVTFTVVRLHLTLSLYLFFFHFARLPQIDCVARQVYAMEKLEAEKVVYHKACFRCTECNKAVSLGTYASLHNKVDT